MTSGGTIIEAESGSRPRSTLPARSETDAGSAIAGGVLTVLTWILIIATFPIAIFFCFKVVQQYERAVIFRMVKVDTRSTVFDIPPQEVLTKDSVTVKVDAVMYYRISDAVLSVTNVANCHSSTKLLAQTTLRGVLGQRNLQDLLAERDAISLAMATTLDAATDVWGIKVERVEITDVRLPLQLQRAMAAEGEAVREAKAKVIAAEGEYKASRALKEAADTLTESPAAIQLRYLQTLTTVASEKNKTIIFPIPIQLINQFMSGWQPKPSDTIQSPPPPPPSSQQQLLAV